MVEQAIDLILKKMNPKIKQSKLEVKLVLVKRFSIK